MSTPHPTPITLVNYGESWAGDRFHLFRVASGVSLCRKWKNPHPRTLGRVTTAHANPYPNECRTCAAVLRGMLAKRKGGVS